MKSHELSRRELLQKCSAAGLLIVAGPLARADLAALWAQGERQRCRPTPPNDLGPFYKEGSPLLSNLRPAGDPGMALVVSGVVLDTRGETLPDARLEIWHADPLGQYDNKGFRYRGQLRAQPSGAYKFETVMPGHYPTRVAQHIHYKVSAPGHQTLVTQLYFATDPVFEGDPDKNFRKDPLLTSRELVRPVELFGDPKSVHAAVRFEICLERA